MRRVRSGIFVMRNCEIKWENVSRESGGVYSCYRELWRNGALGRGIEMSCTKLTLFLKRFYVIRVAMVQLCERREQYWGFSIMFENDKHTWSKT